MTALLLLLGAVLLTSGALWLLLAREALVAWWYRLFQDPDGKSGTGEKDTVAAQADVYERSSWFVDGGHRRDCWERCCIDIRVAEFDWHAREYEMGTKR